MWQQWPLVEIRRVTWRVLREGQPVWPFIDVKPLRMVLVQKSSHSEYDERYYTQHSHDSFQFLFFSTHFWWLDCSLPGTFNGGNDQGRTYFFSPSLEILTSWKQPLAHLYELAKLNETWNTQERQWPRTLQVQVFGSGRCLRGDLGVNLDRVEVVGVSGDDHIVPVVVIQRLIGVAFDQVGSVPQVRHVVEITAIERGGEGWTLEKWNKPMKTGARKFCHVRLHVHTSISGRSCRRSERTVRS